MYHPVSIRQGYYLRHVVVRLPNGLVTKIKLFKIYRIYFKIGNLDNRIRSMELLIYRMPVEEGLRLPKMLPLLCPGGDL